MFNEIELFADRTRREIRHSSSVSFVRSVLETVLDGSSLLQS